MADLGNEWKREGTEHYHDEVIDQIYRSLQKNLDSMPWDEVHKEVKYFYDPEHDLVGQPKGEMDIVLVDKSERVMKYIEIKTRGKDMQYADEQISRAQEHWEEKGWDVEGEKRLHTP